MLVSPDEPASVVLLEQPSQPVIIKALRKVVILEIVSYLNSFWVLVSNYFVLFGPILSYWQYLINSSAIYCNN